jgi:hypothetical protein
MSEYQPVNLKRKNTNNLAIWCSDHRFQPAFQETAERRYGIYEADRIVFPAPSKAIVEGPLMPAIEKLHSLHGFEEVDIFDHIDCGGFGGLEAFDDSEGKEAEMHFKYLKFAKEVIHRAIPRLNVKGHVLGVHDELQPSQVTKVSLEQTSNLGLR